MKTNYELKYLTMKRKYDNIMKKLDYVRTCKPDLKNKSDIEILKYLISIAESEGFY